MTTLDIESFLNLSEIEELDALELSEVLWLAKYMKSSKSYYLPKEVSKENILASEKKDSNNKPQKSSNSTQSKSSPSKTIEVEANDSIALSINTKDNATNSITIGHKGYFDNVSNLPKYLIDFKEKKLSRKRDIFDEDKTVDYIAHTNITFPFFKAKKEKKYELYICIDISDSMQVWEEMTDVYQKLLLNSGVFRSTTLLYIDTQSKESMFYKDKKKRQAFNASEIMNFYSSKLMFVLSDMHSMGWKEGNALEIFAKLYKRIPLYVVQMLPYRLWHTTQLQQSTITTLSTVQGYPLAHSYSSEVDYILESLEANGSKNLKLPIVSFELAYLKVIGKTLKAKEGNRIDGAIFDIAELKDKKINEPIVEKTSEEMVDNFFSISSKNAQKLLVSFSAVPLNFPIMRMIQEKVLEEYNNIALAEVLNSKLLVKKGDFYEFINDEVYEIVFKLLGREKALEIAYKNSDYIQENLNSKFGFKALLAGKIDLEDSEKFSQNDKLFAFISCRLLKSLGGEYAKRAGCKGKKKIQAIIPTSKRFIMGSEDGDKDEKLAHEVIINYDFEIAKTPVTVGEFRVFVEEISYETEAEKGDGAYVYDGKDWGNKKDASWKNPYFEQTDDNPVVCVSWNDAQSYIKWLNVKTRENYRLPTEAEWEFSCRADTISKWNFDDKKYKLKEYAWYFDNSDYKTHPVGKLKVNDCGLYDMHGNVWEWCQDDYVDNYKNTPRDGSEHVLEKKKYKSLRGGSWFEDAFNARSAIRDWYKPSGRDSCIGFRLLRTLP